MFIDHGDLVLLINGSRVILLSNRGDSRNLELEIIHSMSCKSKRTSDSQRDRAGQTMNSSINGYSSYENENYHQIVEQNFLKMANLAINTFAKNGNHEHIIIAAEPTALGYLRKIMDPIVSSKIVKEIPKDYTKMPVIELEKTIRRI